MVSLHKRQPMAKRQELEWKSVVQPFYEAKFLDCERKNQRVTEEENLGVEV